MPDPNAGSDNAQATVGDSGGGVFLSDGTLIGLIDAEGTFSGQPANTSVFGDGTFIADLSKYRPEILSIVAVPEVPTPVLLLGGLALVGTLRHRRRRKTADITCRYSANRQLLLTLSSAGPVCLEIKK